MLPPVYIGNYEYDADERELERLFEKYGKVDRVEFKSGAPPAAVVCVVPTEAGRRQGRLRPRADLASGIIARVPSVVGLRRPHAPLAASTNTLATR